MSAESVIGSILVPGLNPSYDKSNQQQTRQVSDMMGITDRLNYMADIVSGRFQSC